MDLDVSAMCLLSYSFAPYGAPDRENWETVSESYDRTNILINAAADSSYQKNGNRAKSNVKQWLRIHLEKVNNILTSDVL